MNVGLITFDNFVSQTKLSIKHIVIKWTTMVGIALQNDFLCLPKTDKHNIEKMSDNRAVQFAMTFVKQEPALLLYT